MAPGNLLVKDNYLSPNPIPLSTLNAISESYDVFFIDLWGVTHNGKEPFPHAIKAYETLKAKGKTLIVLSNAPRLPEKTRERLKNTHINPDLFDDIFTSGYECHLALRDRPDDFYENLGSKLFHIGPQKDESTFANIGYEKVTSMKEADFVLITGTEDWEKTTDAYHDRLCQAAERQLPLVCANADKIVSHGGDLVVCAGAIADAYHAMGDMPIRIHGKPNSSVYHATHILANTHRQEDVHLSRILMLGDSLATDIKGANTYGIDSVLTLTGVHAAVNFDEFSALYADYNSYPTYVMKNGIA